MATAKKTTSTKKAAAKKAAPAKETKPKAIKLGGVPTKGGKVQ